MLRSENNRRYFAGRLVSASTNCCRSSSTFDGSTSLNIARFPGKIRFTYAYTNGNVFGNGINWEYCQAFVLFSASACRRLLRSPRDFSVPPDEISSSLLAYRLIGRGRLLKREGTSSSLGVTRESENLHGFPSSSAAATLNSMYSRPLQKKREYCNKNLQKEQVGA